MSRAALPDAAVDDGKAEPWLEPLAADTIIVACDPCAISEAMSTTSDTDMFEPVARGGDREGRGQRRGQDEDQQRHDRSQRAARDEHRERCAAECDHRADLAAFPWRRSPSKVRSMAA